MTTNKTPVIRINPDAPDIEVTNPDDYEPPEIKLAVEEPEAQKYCLHEQIRIFPRHRLIQCRACHATLDPFDYLLQMGKQECNYNQYIKSLVIQSKSLEKELGEVRKELNQAIKEQYKK